MEKYEVNQVNQVNQVNPSNNALTRLKTIYLNAYKIYQKNSLYINRNGIRYFITAVLACVLTWTKNSYKEQKNSSQSKH